MVVSSLLAFSPASGLSFRERGFAIGIVKNKRRRTLGARYWTSPIPEKLPPKNNSLGMFAEKLRSFAVDSLRQFHACPVFAFSLPVVVFR